MRSRKKRFRRKSKMLRRIKRRFVRLQKSTIVPDRRKIFEHVTHLHGFIMKASKASPRKLKFVNS